MLLSMENAANGETRHKMLRTYENREAEENTRLQKLLSYYDNKLQSL